MTDWIEGDDVLSVTDWIEGDDVLSMTDWIENKDGVSLTDWIEGDGVVVTTDWIDITDGLSVTDWVKDGANSIHGCSGTLYPVTGYHSYPSTANACEHTAAGGFDQYSKCL